jgi:hypothetical protein
MQIDEIKEQCANVESSIDETFDPGSNMTVESEVHSLKHFSPSLSTDAGIQIDESDEQCENAEAPMRESAQPDSNVTPVTVRL